MFSYVALIAGAVAGIVLTGNATERPGSQKSDIIYLDCGGPDRFVVVKNVNFTPMPVALPGKAKISVHFNLTNDIPDRLDVDMLMEKLSENGEWLPVPCMLNFGSCTLRGVDTCEFTFGLLGCPIMKGNYEITDDLSLPYFSEWMLSSMVGEYRVSMRIRGTGATEIACVNLWFGIKRGSQKASYYEE